MMSCWSLCWSSLSNSGGDTLLQGTQVRAGGGYAFNAGVGERARACARAILEGVKTTVQQSKTAKSDYVVWQSMANSGSKVETLALPSFAGGGTFSAPGGLSVQLPDGDFKRQITSLSQQPGMGYLNDLAARTDVNWQAVKLAHDQWNYSQSGLTPAGAALLAVAVTWATGGMGASLVGGTITTTTATGATLTTTTTAGLMANAAFSSLAAQASITLVNNKGDIGKTLKDMGTSSTVKATLAAVLTAGVIDKLGATSTMSELSKTGQFADKLTYNLINATGRALTTTAINGGDLQGALKSALIGGLVDTAQGEAASLIGQSGADYLSHKLAHALVGCVAGAAAGGACKDGAIGGAVGEIVAEMFKDQRPAASAGAVAIDAYNQKVLAYSKLVAGAVAAYAGGNAQTAITTAETAVRNNYLTDAQKQKKDKELASCSSLVCAAGVVAKYGGISGAQDAALLMGVAGGVGYQSYEQAVAVVDMLKNPSATFAALNALVNDPDFRARAGTQLTDDYKQRIGILLKSYNEDGLNGASAAGVEVGRLAVDIVGVATATVGVTKVAATVTKVASAVVVDAFTLTSETAANFLAKITNGTTVIGSSIADLKAISAVDANAPFIAKGWSAPYDTVTQVRTFMTTSSITFVRVSTTENPIGQFLVRADEIAGMSATQIQQYLALPKTPTQISEVIVPSGIRMQVGKVAPQPGFAANSAGGIQYQLLDTIPSSSFKTPKPL